MKEKEGWSTDLSRLHILRIIIRAGAAGATAHLVTSTTSTNKHHTLSPSWTRQHTAGRTTARESCASGSIWMCICHRRVHGQDHGSHWEYLWRPPYRGRSCRRRGSWPPSWSQWWTCLLSRWRMFPCSRLWCIPDSKSSYRYSFWRALKLLWC